MLERCRASVLEWQDRCRDALEFAAPDARGYWDYAIVQTGADGTLDVALDSSGDLHACFRKDSTVWFH